MMMHGLANVKFKAVVFWVMKPCCSVGGNHREPGNGSSRILQKAG